jgi:hypothetical protein
MIDKIFRDKVHFINFDFDSLTEIRISILRLVDQTSNDNNIVQTNKYSQSEFILFGGK